MISTLSNGGKVVITTAGSHLVCKRVKIWRPIARHKGRPSRLVDQAFDALQGNQLSGYRLRISLASRGHSNAMPIKMVFREA